MNALAIPALLLSCASAFSFSNDAHLGNGWLLRDQVQGEQLAIEGWGCPALGHSMRVLLRNAPPSSVAVLVFRVAEAHETIEPLGSPEGVVSAPITIDEDGYGTLSFPLGQDPAALGLYVDFQWGAFDPASGAILTSEVLRGEILPELETLHTQYDIDVDLGLVNLFGADGLGSLEGTASVSVQPGIGDDQLIAEVTSIALEGDSTLLSNGRQTGPLSLRLQEPLRSAIYPAEGFRFESDLVLELIAPLLQPSELQVFESNPAPLEVLGALSLDWRGMGGTLRFRPAAGGSSSAKLSLDGALLVPDKQAQVLETFARLIPVRTTIVRNAAGTSPAFTPEEVQELFLATNSILGPQCCIKVVPDGPARFVDDDSLQDMGFAERVLLDQGNNTPGVIDLVLSHSITGPKVGATLRCGEGDPSLFIGREGAPNSLAHELGHALGLGASDAPGNLMNQGSGASELSKRQSDFLRGSRRTMGSRKRCTPKPQG